MELSGPDIKKNFLIFSQQKAVLICQEMETLKKFLIFQEMELSYISGSNPPYSKSKKNYSEKTSYISGNGTFKPQP